MPWTRFKWPHWRLVLAGTLAAVVGAVWWWIYVTPSVQETAIVTIVQPLGGGSGKWRSSYRYRARFEDGSERLVTLGQLFPRGTRVKLNYRRTSESGRIQVDFYIPCGKDPGC